MTDKVKEVFYSLFLVLVDSLKMFLCVCVCDFLVVTSTNINQFA